MFTRIVVAIGILATFASTATAQDCSRYYFILFGGQGVPFRARTAHTWGTYVKTSPMVTGLTAVDSFTISWLPPDGNVRPYRFRPESGHNFTLEETLAIMGKSHAAISMWGPYEIEASHYEDAIRQLNYLNSGKVRYRAVDSFNLNDTTVNCVHATTHADPLTSRYIQPVIRVGEPGTSRLAKLYRRHGVFSNYPQTADWLVPVLGLDTYPHLTKREPGERIPRRLM